MKAKYSCAIQPIGCLFFVWIFCGLNPDTASASEWASSDAKALRELVANSDVILSTYLNEAGLPLKRLDVPDSFVELYRKDPKQCLTVLLDIVERGKPEDVIVAFHFANAGDEPQIALPLLHYLNSKMLDEPFGKTETYRQFCVRLTKAKLIELEKRKQQK
jgi:hypothetical protein